MKNFEFKQLKRNSWKVSEPRKKGMRVLIPGIFLMGIAVLITLFVTLKPAGPPEPSGEGGVPVAEEPELQTIEGEVKERSSLFKSLLEQKISLQWIDLIISKLRPFVDFKKIQGGTYKVITDMRGDLIKFIFEVGPTEVYEVEKDPEGYVAQRKEVMLDRYLAKVVGEIRSSLFEAMDATGEKDTLTLPFAEILAWEIDFYKDVREGDRFKVLVEKMYKGDQFIQYGTIHAVAYQNGEKNILGIRFKEGYYSEQGISLQKAFLKAPLRFNRISSRFSRARKHPILGGLRPHYGVDYAAPTGTPIWAVGDGTVVSCGWNGGFGKQVVLRHRNGYMTYYGHLSGYGPGIRKNKKVRQKQIIGYVGSTGLSTGPHLDYRMTKDGKFKNPLKETFPAGFSIEKSELDHFQKTKDRVLGWLEGDTPYQKRAEAGDSML